MWPFRKKRPSTIEFIEQQHQLSDQLYSKEDQLIDVVDKQLEDAEKRIELSKARVRPFLTREERDFGRG